MSETVTEFGAVQPAPYIPGNDDLALELCALSREFRLNRGLFARPGIFSAVNNVSLRVRRGETLGLVGKSGGKSTLAKMLLGLLPPTSGNVLIEGREIDASDRKALATRIQPIFQDPYSSLNPRRTVADRPTLFLGSRGVFITLSFRSSCVRARATLATGVGYWQIPASVWPTR